MADKNLTQKIIDAAKPQEKDYVIWDGALRAFGARVHKSGRKTYIVRYRTQAGTQRTQTVCRCTDKSPEDARKLAKQIFAQVAEGHDPMAEKQFVRAMPTVAELAGQYMKEHAATRKKASSAKNDEGLWRRNILPIIGSKKVCDVTKADVMKIHNALADKPSTANQAKALLSKAFNLAEDWAYRPAGSNPAKQVARFKENHRELILNQEQLANLHAALDALTDAGAILPQMAALVRLLLLSGCRLNEIMSARKSWIDRERRLLMLPEAGSKTGWRNVDLPAAAFDIIDTLPAGDWLIPGKEAGQPLKYPYTAWQKIKVAANLPAELRIHDLRHTVGSLAHRAGLSQREVAQILGHKQLKTTERYLHGLAGDGQRAVDMIASMTAPA